MRFRFFVVFLCAFALTAPAIAAGKKPVLDKPVYLEANDTYYELVSSASLGVKARRLLWRYAKAASERRHYKGRRGRLAVVTSAEVHNFIRDALRPNQSAWIGLRFFCRYNKGLWVNGKRLDAKVFARWGRVWNVRGANPANPRRSQCTRAPYLAVHYWSVARGFAWNANEPDKEFDHAIIEYPPADKYFE